MELGGTHEGGRSLSALMQSRMAQIQTSLDMKETELPSEANDEAAAAFESYFATLLVRELRRGLPEGLFSGAGSDVYSSWFDEQIGATLSERDALAAIAAAHYEDEPPGTVAQHMRRDFAVVADDADVFEVASVFREQPIRRVPVVDTERRLLGIISRGDVLKALRRTFPRRPPNKYEQMQEHLSLKQGQH